MRLLRKNTLYNIEILGKVVLPLVGSVPCGAPALPADYVDAPIDLNELLIKNPAATYCFIADGESLIGEHVADGSMLIVDRSIPPRSGHLALVMINGEYTAKKLDMELMRLLPANPSFQPIVLSDGMEVMVCGVITAIVIDPYKKHVRLR